MTYTIRILALFCAVTVSCAAFGQSSGRNVSRSRPRLANPYFYGNQGYGVNTYGAINPYVGSAIPYAQTRPLYTPVPVAQSLPPVTGPIEKYSPVEYGEIVKMALAASKKYDPAGPTDQGPKPTIVEMTTGTLNAGKPTYSPVSTSVSDILDRGVLLLPTGEELRMRGVTMPSITDTNEVSRLYAKEGNQILRNLSRDREITVLLDEPLRDNTGRLLGTILLSDGTELNRRMVELGYGTVNAEDFASDVDYSDLTKAQDNARQQRLGIWSANF